MESRDVTTLVPELVEALDKRPYQGGMGISYYLQVKHPKLALAHSEYVQLVYELAKRRSWRIPSDWRERHLQEVLGDACEAHVEVRV